MRKLRKLNPEEVVEEEVLDPEVIGEVLDNAEVMSDEELAENDVPVPDFDEDEDTEINEEDLDLDAIGEVLDNAEVMSDEELENADVPTPDFDEDEDEDTEINEEDLDLDLIGEVLNDVDPKPAAKKSVAKKPATKKSKTTKKAAAKKSTTKTKSKTTTPRTAIKVALPNTMSLEELKAKKSVNMSDLSSFIFSYLVDHQPATKKNIEEMVSLIFTDILPHHMDNEHPIRLGDLRIGYSKVSGRVYENSKLSESLEQLGEFDTYVEPHTVARFKREINKVSHRGKLSPTKKTFTLAEADKNGKLKLTKKTLKL